MLNINFITNNTDINRGSYRIWIKDIDDLIKKSKLANSKIVTDVKDIDPDCDVIIIGKSFYKNANQVKNYFPSKNLIRVIANQYFFFSMVLLLTMKDVVKSFYIKSRSVFFEFLS